MLESVVDFRKFLWCIYSPTAKNLSIRLLLRTYNSFGYKRRCVVVKKYYFRNHCLILAPFWLGACDGYTPTCELCGPDAFQGMLVMAMSWDSQPGPCPLLRLTASAEWGRGLARRIERPVGSGWCWLGVLLERLGSLGLAPTPISAFALHRSARLTAEEAKGKG